MIAKKEVTEANIEVSSAEDWAQMESEFIQKSFQYLSFEVFKKSISRKEVLFQTSSGEGFSLDIFMKSKDVFFIFEVLIEPSSSKIQEAYEQLVRNLNLMKAHFNLESGRAPVKNILGGFIVSRTISSKRDWIEGFPFLRFDMKTSSFENIEVLYELLNDYNIDRRNI